MEQFITFPPPGTCLAFSRDPTFGFTWDWIEPFCETDDLGVEAVLPK